MKTIFASHSSKRASFRRGLKDIAMAAFCGAIIVIVSAAFMDAYQFQQLGDCSGCILLNKIRDF